MVFDFDEFITKIDKVTRAVEVISAYVDITIGKSMIREGTQKLSELQQQQQTQPQVEATA